VTVAVTVLRSKRSHSRVSGNVTNGSRLIFGEESF
jgi:hypothetical protein